MGESRQALGLALLQKLHVLCEPSSQLQHIGRLDGCALRPWPSSMGGARTEDFDLACEPRRFLTRSIVSVAITGAIPTTGGTESRRLTPPAQWRGICPPRS